jgi:hypothetical protein
MHINNKVTTRSDVMFVVFPILWLELVMCLTKAKIWLMISKIWLEAVTKRSSRAATSAQIGLDSHIPRHPKTLLLVTFHVSDIMSQNMTPHSHIPRQPKMWLAVTSHVEVPHQQKYNSTESHSTSAENMTPQSHVPRRMPRQQKIWLYIVTCHVGFWPRLPGQMTKSQRQGSVKLAAGDADVACTWSPSIRFGSYLFIWLGVRSDSSVMSPPCHPARHIPGQQKIWLVVTEPVFMTACSHKRSHPASHKSTHLA